MTAVGEAAGLAAAEAARTGKSVDEIDGAQIRERLSYMDAEPNYDQIWSAGGRVLDGG
jgi:hypothetical protein